MAVEWVCGFSQRQVVVVVVVVEERVLMVLEDYERERVGCDLASRLTSALSWSLGTGSPLIQEELFITTNTVQDLNSPIRLSTKEVMLLCCVMMIYVPNRFRPSRAL
jgi:hypothetical protein